MDDFSKYIKALEQEYKTKLFDRKGLHIEQTEAESLLYEKLLEVNPYKYFTSNHLDINPIKLFISYNY